METTGREASAGRPRITLFTRTGCHLCEDARRVVAQVSADCGEIWREVDVDDDPEDRAEYGDLVPVVLVDDVVHGYHTVESAALRAALGH